MKKLFLILVCFTNLWLANNLSAQTQQWSAVYNNSTADLLENAVVDNSGNTYITGLRYTPSSSGYYQYLAKYNPSGSFQWQRFFYGPYASVQLNRGTTSFTSALDNSGNVYIAGYTDSAISYTKGYLMKYSPNGDSIWCKFAGINDTIGYAQWYSMKIDNSGNIYVGGFYFTQDLNKRGYLLAKYNTSGVLQWIKSQKPASFYSTTPIGFKLLTDNSSNVYIVSTLQKGSSTLSKDFYIFKYNSSGAFQWQTLYNGPADEADEVSSATLDLSGNVYIEGLRSNIAPIYNEITCIKLNGSSGALQWTYAASGTGANGDDKAFGIAAGISNDIYLTGSLFYSPGGGENGVLIKLNSSTGAEAWRKTMTTDQPFGSDMYTDVKVIYSGTIYALGILNYFSTNSIVQVKKFNAAGDSLAGATYAQSNYMMPKSIITGPGSSLFIGGDNTTGVPAGDVFIVKYDVTTGIEPVSNTIPDKFSLSQNYPNPFNPETKINFAIPKDVNVSLKVYDINGKEIANLLNEFKSAGLYTAEFNGANLASGIYFIKMIAGETSFIRKMSLIK